jgi:hypothetical protein
MRTCSYFDGRPDARHFMADVDGVLVMIRQNLPTGGVTDGEVWVAFRVHDRLVERRFEGVDRARRATAHFVRDTRGTRADSPTIGAWIAIARAEHAIACPHCLADQGRPCCDDDGEPMLARRGSVLVVGAPQRPEMHEAEVDLPPLVHAGRCTAHHRALHGAPRNETTPGHRSENFIK